MDDKDFTLRVTGINTGPFNSLVELLLTAYIDNSYTRYSYVTGRRKRFRPHKAYIYSRVRLSVCFYEPAFIRTDGQTDMAKNGRTGGHGKVDSSSDPDQDYIYFMGQEMLPSACYIIFD